MCGNERDGVKLNSEVISLSDVLVILKKRLIMIVAIVAVATISAGIVSWFVIKPTYQSSTKLFIGKEGKITGTTTVEGGEYESSDVSLYQSLMKTYGEIIKSPDLIQRALDEAKLDLTSAEVLSGLSVIPQDKSQILEMNFKTGNAYDAQKVLKAINEEFVKTSKKLISNGTVEVIMEPRLPVSPVSPNKMMNLAIAFMAGFMFSVGLALFLEFLDNSVKNPKEIEELLGVTVIGMVPELDPQDPKHSKTSKREKKRRQKALEKRNKAKNNLEEKTIMAIERDTEKSVEAVAVECENVKVEV